jgi:membrane associated rhomboid family serine protease
LSRPRRFTDLAHLPTPAVDALIVINLAVYVAWQVALLGWGGDGVHWMERHFTISWTGLYKYRLWTLLTNAFSHQNTIHLLMNMLALRVFGQDVERMVGASGFVRLYLSGGLVAALGHLAYTAATRPIPALGASGSVMAIAMVSALMFPTRWLLVLFIPVPAIVAMVGFIATDLIGLLTPGGSPIAHAAHLAGAAWGALWWRYRARSWVLERMRAIGILPSQRRLRPH